MLVIIYSKLLILAVRQKDTKSYRPPLPIWIIKFIIQLNKELYELMAEGHTGPSNDAGGTPGRRATPNTHRLFVIVSIRFYWDFNGPR